MGSPFLNFAMRHSLMPKMDCFIQIISFEEKFHGNCIFLANGCVLEQNLRKETPLRIQFYCQNIMTLPIETFSKAWQWHRFDFGINFTHFYIVTSNLLPNFLMALTHSFFNILLSVTPLDPNVVTELPQQVNFKPETMT